MTRPSWLDPLVGHELRDALEVDVHFASEAPLTSGDLVLETDRGWFQLLSVASERALRSMQTPSDVKLIGDWSDRTGIVLRSTRALEAPFRVGRIDYAQRAGGTSGRETIGAWLLDDRLAVRVAVLLDLEDVEMGSPERLWSHLAQIAHAERTVVVFGAK